MSELSTELTPAQYKELMAHWGERDWRLNNIYKIIDKDTRLVTFKPNYIQQQIYANQHNRNIVVKPRKIGVSTHYMILYLDSAMFTGNLTIGVIAHTLKTAGTFLKMMRLAYNNLPEIIRNERKLISDVKSSELSFNNGSSIYVGTSFMGQTPSDLHISELGTICCKNPEKAYEIVTGSIESVGISQCIVIESTALGMEGYFAEQVEMARKRQEANKPLTRLDYKLFFFPWYVDPTCALKPEEAQQVTIYPHHIAYFEEIETKQNCKINILQRAFYVQKEISLGFNIKSQYPSNLKEAFLLNMEGAIFSEQFTYLRENNRLTKVPYQEGALVDVAWDLGVGHEMVLWFCQTVGREYHIIDCYHNAGVGYGHYYDVMKEKGYRYGMQILPHDISVTEQSTGVERLSTMIGYFGRQHCYVVPREGKEDAIEITKRFLSLCWFDDEKCHEGIDGLESYTREWDSRNGKYKTNPKDDWAADYADSFKYLAIYKMMQLRRESRTIPEIVNKVKQSMPWGKGFT